MTDIAASVHAIVAYAKTLRGDEKGEAQVFCDYLLRAFGHDGYLAAPNDPRGGQLRSRYDAASTQHAPRP